MKYSFMTRKEEKLAKNIFLINNKNNKNKYWLARVKISRKGQKEGGNVEV